MRSCLLFFLLVSCLAVEAQFPRNDLDRYELSHDMTVNAPDSVLQRRAKDFFRQPFIIHWDSVAFTPEGHTGRGHIFIQINHWLRGFQVPVALTMEVTVKPNGYHYSIRNMEACKKDSKYQFPLESKPEAVNAVIYEKIVQKTFSYLSATVSFLKRYMAGEWQGERKRL